MYLIGVGGAAAFSKPVFESINGFTNSMFGWGGEDDEAYSRYIIVTEVHMLHLLLDLDM